MMVVASSLNIPLGTNFVPDKTVFQGRIFRGVTRLEDGQDAKVACVVVKRATFEDFRRQYVEMGGDLSVMGWNENDHFYWIQVD